MDLKKTVFRHSLWLMIFLAACSPAVEGISTTKPDDLLIKPIETNIPTHQQPLTNKTPTRSNFQQEPGASTTQTATRRVDPDVEYRMPAALLPYDGIRPIYTPEFARPNEAFMHDDELVMGVSIDGEARAYPVTVLRFREMVNDEIAGWPVLVSW